jgi:hypothetical protein
MYNRCICYVVALILQLAYTSAINTYKNTRTYSLSLSCYTCCVVAFDLVACTRSAVGNGCILRRFFSFLLTSNKVLYLYHSPRYACMHVYTYICVHASMCTHTYAYMQACILTYLHTHIYIQMPRVPGSKGYLVPKGTWFQRVPGSKDRFVRTCTYTHTYLHTYIYIYTYLLTHIHVHIHRAPGSYQVQKIDPYIHVHIHILTCTHKFTYTHTYLHTYMYIYTGHLAHIRFKR